jgi:hypothetical protein
LVLKTLPAIAATILLLSAIPSIACSAAACVGRGTEMRPGFAVKITHDKNPLSGANVQVTSRGSELFSGITLADGTVRVIGLPPGDYWLIADFLGIGAAYECFHISDQPSRKAKRRLAFEWGDDAAATTRIAGKLIDSQPGKGGDPLWNILHRVDVPIRGAGLKLQNPITGAIYLADSDNDGNFAFDGIAEGIYVLHIAGGGTDSRDYDPTDLLIELSFSASRNTLLLKRREGGAGSCGDTSLGLEN